MKIRTAFLALAVLPRSVVGTCPPARADKPLVVVELLPALRVREAGRGRPR